MPETIAWTLAITFFALLCVYAALGIHNRNTERKNLAKVSEIVDMTLTVEQLRYKAALDELTKVGGTDGE